MHLYFCKLAHVCMHAHAHVHARTHARTHAHHTHTHTHTHTHNRLNDMKAHKKAMGHGTLSKKYEKKDLAKEIKSMEELMRC